MKSHTADEIESRCAAVREQIAALTRHVDQSLMPLLWPSRTVMPPPGSQPAVVVRLDRDDIVAIDKNRTPYHEVEQLFLRNKGEMDELCNNLKLIPASGISNHRINDTDPYWDNPYFGPMDARLLMAVTRHFRPKRILEIGSGNSTKFFRRAIDDGRLTTRLTSIDPQPRVDVDRLVDEVLRQNVLDCTLDRFIALDAGDILFLDGSHLTFHGCDTVHFFLRILPVLKPGVLVHLHDIYLPEEYPSRIDELYYSEQYMLAVHLLNNAGWRTLLPAHFLFLQGLLDNDGVSFWMIRN